MHLGRVAQRLFHRQVFLHCRHHNAWRHHGAGLNRLEQKQVADDLGLAVVDHALLFANAGHGHKFVAAEVVQLLAPRNQLGELFRHHDQRVHALDEHIDIQSREAGQLTPVHRTQGLGHDFGQKQNQQGHDR